MLRSMTAYACEYRQTEFGLLRLELRSVNHRYLELSPRLPEEIRPVESQLRARVTQSISRGKVDLNVRLERSAESSASQYQLNKTLAQQLVKWHSQLCSQAGMDPQATDITRLLQWPGLIEEKQIDSESLGQAALETLDIAVQKLINAREREGATLANTIQTRLDSIATIVAQVEQWLPEIRQQTRERLQTRIAEMQVEVSADRLEQEVAILLQKLDVDEELDRLRSHLQEVAHILQSDEPVGRRLDFMMQELNREANTLGSKSVDTRLSQAAVELKVLIEQMREQVQNIE